MSKNILVFCAHSDDEAVGMGGSIAKYIGEGNEIIKVVFSYGQRSHPHWHERIVTKERLKETDKANKYLGISRTINFGLTDSQYFGFMGSQVAKEAEEQEINKKVETLIKKYNPEKIFLPFKKDSHADHRAVYEVVTQAILKLRKKYQMYGFECWDLGDERHSYIYEDISDYLDRKVNYMKMFKSQWIYMYMLLPLVYYRAYVYGKHINVRYAERFYKIR